MASRFLHARFPERLAARVRHAADTENVTVSRWLRLAALDRLQAASAAESERLSLLAEARAFLASHRDGGYEVPIVERLAGFLELVDGRISRAEQRGRQRALSEIAAGSLRALAPDGEVIELASFQLRDERDLPVVLEAQPPRRRGFLRMRLIEQQARELLAAAPRAEPLPRAGLLGEQAARQAWNEAVGWPGWRRVFCPVHGIVPSAPSSDGTRCYLGCELQTGDDPEAA